MSDVPFEGRRACRTPLLGGAGARRRWRSLRARRPARRQRDEGAALRVPDRRDRVRSGAGQRPVLAHGHGQHLRAPLTYDYLARPAKLVPNTAEAMPEISADFKTLRVPHATRHPLRRRPGVQGRSANCRRRLRLSRSSATTTRSSRAQRCTCSRTASSACRDCAGGGADKGAVRLRPRGRGLRALDRYTFRSSSPSRRRASPYFADNGHSARSRAKSSRCTTTNRSWRNPVGTGPFGSLSGAAPRDRARAQPRLPRGLQRASHRRRCGLGSDRRAAEGPQVAADRSRRGLHHRGEPAALAGRS